MQNTTRPRIESNSIYPVPLDQRHGSARNLFTLWFGTNAVILTVATGALAPAVFHLSFAASVLAILVGNMVGAVFMALHAVQGPQLGVPQMVQTRSQFGAQGALAIIGVMMIMYVGFVASNLVLAQQSLQAVFGAHGAAAGIALVCAASLAAAVYGYDLIHAYAHVVAWMAGAVIIGCFGWILMTHEFPVGKPGIDGVAGFFGVVSTCALWQISYAPYVADYSRYLPADIGTAKAFWACYLGTVLGSVFPMVLGALLVSVAGVSDVGSALSVLLGSAAMPAVVVFTIAIVVANAMNLYCGALAAITVAQTARPGWRVGTGARVAFTILLGGGAMALGLAAAGSFLQAYTNFLQLLLCVLVPWTAINLVDYYLVSHGSYDFDSLFRADGGRYGRFNAAALGCYLLGICVQIPFLVTDYFTGPAAVRLGRVDVSWIVGLLVIGPVYWLVTRRANLAVTGVRL